MWKIKKHNLGDHIEIDREWVRDQKLNKLINGIS